MRLLDLFCCEGGAGAGYALAGFDVVGVDTVDRAGRYPLTFVQADAIEYIREHGHAFDAIHASPPCQVHSITANFGSWEEGAHVNLVPATREALRASGKPYVIENVEGAPLLHPTMLCGEMFGMRLHRHRLFETGGFLLPQPHHPVHKWRGGWDRNVGRKTTPDRAVLPVGNFAGVDEVRGVMAMPWASRYGLAQAIPPAYTKYIGDRLVAHLRGESIAQLELDVA